MWYLRDIYQQFAEKELEKHDDWWGKYEQKVKMKNCYLYEQKNGQIILRMSWYMFKNIIEAYYHKAKDAIIKGETLRLGNELGFMRAIRVERNFDNPTINWPETFKQRQFDAFGKIIKVYYTDDDWCRIQWAKFNAITNETLYVFTPAKRNMSTNKGFTYEFSKALKTDPLLKFKYKYFPYVSYKNLNSQHEQIQSETHELSTD
jgi:hypothetical protein